MLPEAKRDNEAEAEKMKRNSRMTGCARTGSQKKCGSAFFETSDNAYRERGISPSAVAPWEDGMRTDGKPGSYEWWYFDATLNDGSSIVIAFYTKDSIVPNTPIKPRVTLELVRPDGTTVKKAAYLDAEFFSASKDKCDVRIGENSCSGDLHVYSIHVAIDDVTADIKLVGTVPAWRPNTGHMVFKRKRNNYFAWLPSVPRGDVSGTLTLAGKSQIVTGTGYHDHNWGDISMLKLIHHWYWGRAQVGPYSLIASVVTANDKYGQSALPVFMLAKNGNIIADDSSCVKYSATDVYMDDKTGKPVANKLIYNYDDGKQHYRIIFDRHADILRVPFLESAHGFKYIIAKLLKFDGAYLRFTGLVTLEKMVDTEIVETVSEQAAVWELMYFGRAPVEITAK